MTERITDIANRFLDEKRCSIQELAALKKWLSNPFTHTEVENWLSDHWDLSSEIDSNAMIANVFKQIQECRKEQKQKLRRPITRILNWYQRIAAFLLIPLIGLGIIYWLSQYNQSTAHYTETIAPRGQKSLIVLADGTKVWLNSDTKIKYPGTFSKNQRDIYLDGEAFFEVTKNVHQPFVVHTSALDVKVLGTKFNVRAYPDDDQIETSLFEGKVNLSVNQLTNNKQKERTLMPGESILYSKTDNELIPNLIPKDEINGWKNNQLIFRDDTFSKLVKKAERWYNVKMVYDEKLFSDRRLTVELYEGERLEILMDIISLALSVDFKYEKETIILTPKRN